MKERGKDIPALSELRRGFHRELFESCVRLRDRQSPNMADSASRQSVAIAQGVIGRLDYPKGSGEVSSQTLGANFAEATARFLESA
ncbi:MAG: NgoMIV family type II restriction endonuclease, partial [Phycisphaerales bacterium]|nr:NgoMIV family type II restriction endonuclease [Phycisphaerales bacterium]